MLHGVGGCGIGLPLLRGRRGRARGMPFPPTGQFLFVSDLERSVVGLSVERGLAEKNWHTGGVDHCVGEADTDG